MSIKTNQVYLDNNSTTSLSQDVAGVILDLVVHDIFGNPSSAHAGGVRIKAIVEASRYSVAKVLGCDQDEIYFTSGGTESNNLAIRGTYNIYSHAYNDVVISAAEHSSVFNTVNEVATENDVRFIPLLPDGSLDMEWAERLITEETSIVSVMLANNETGVIFDIKEIVNLAHNRGAIVHCDAVQAFGKIPIDVRELGVDLMSISGHKAHALPGVGALYVRKGIQIHPILFGGGQEMKLRPGTENYIGIASLGAVAGEMVRDGLTNSSGLRDAFEKAILKKIPDVVINGQNTTRVFNTSSMTFKGVSAASLVEALSERGVLASVGSACSSGLLKPSRTMKSMGMSDEDALSTVRFSFSKYSTPADTSTAIEECVDCVSLLRDK